MKVSYSDIRRDIPEEVFLLPVSKTKSYEMVMEAYEEGARCFGENRVQEVRDKFPLPSDRPEGMKVFLIGQLQKNKVRKAVELCDRIESVDSQELLELIDREALRIDRRIDVLLEFNSSDEAQKNGYLSEEDVLSSLKSSLDMKGVRVIGLMTVGPLGFDEEKNRVAFQKTKRLFDEMKKVSDEVKVLSMGMSADYREAISEGSNEVRIGSAIFGGRA